MISDQDLLTALGLHEAGMEISAIIKVMKMDVPAKVLRKAIREALAE